MMQHMDRNVIIVVLSKKGLEIIDSLQQASLATKCIYWESWCPENAHIYSGHKIEQSQKVL